ncbi:MAG: hypothetical protein WCW78_01250 [Candidatus Paceibacterota bacterium]|jgi:TRAP-type C4-dicarboxylate transport system permease small subunit
MKKLISLFTIASAIIPLATFAAPSSVGDIYTYVQRIINWIAVFFFLLAAIFILMAAYKYLTGKGDPEAVKEAQNMLIYAVVGIVVAGLAFALPNVVINFLNVTTTYST